MARAKTEGFEESAVRLAGFAKVLAHPARLLILRHVAEAGELACMAIVAALPLSQPACSRHINELKRAGLLTSREVGTRILFQINRAALDGFCHAMNEALHPPGAPAPAARGRRRGA